MDKLIKQAKAKLNQLKSQNKPADAYELEKAINTLLYSIEAQNHKDIAFAVNVLNTILEDL